jgi:hypothetical protein
MAASQILCPSSRCELGAILLGIVMPNGQVAFSANHIVIDEEFVRIAKEAGSPEHRLRFSGLCVQGACKQWTGSRCGVIGQVLEAVPEAERTSENDLPECSIRVQCRWFQQEGALACSVCSFVVTDTREDEEGE